MAAKALMIQGTGSHVGKSLLTTSLCRIFTQDGFRVLPFKAQNMSNNAFVTKEGGEIGRAQAEQAHACGVEPSVLMNPVLLKPTTDIGAQVIVLGKAVGTMTAREYRAFKPQVRTVIVQSLQQLMDRADVLVIEGAGSPAEINLKDDDLVNMWVAQQADAPVLLVGDIDRGGLFAQLVGTMELLSEEERRRVRGFIINKFRGDLSLLEPGIRWLEGRYHLPVLGTIPYLPDVALAEEDSVPPLQRIAQDAHGQIRIHVIHLPRISNFTDFDPLRREPEVQLQFVDRPSSGPLPDCVILPGSKSTIADLAFVRERGFEAYLQRCRHANTEIVGICGGFQMLGNEILDPDHVEATAGAAHGLELLPFVTVFTHEKIVTQARGIHLESGLPVVGYEIHMGRMREESGPHAVVKFTQRSGFEAEGYDGLRSHDAQVWGTHLHGMFDMEGVRRWWLNRLRARKGLPALPSASMMAPGDAYDQLAEAVRGHLAMKAIEQMLRSA